MTSGVHDIISENEELKIRLAEAEEALDAIRNGEVDAIVVSGQEGERVFSLTSAETPYRILIEEMEEGAVTLNNEGIILYCNKRFITMTCLSAGQVIGNPLVSFIEDKDHSRFNSLLKKGKKERYSGEFSLKSASNLHEFYLFTVNSLPPGITGDLFAIISNITTLKKYEFHLQNLVKELEVEKKRFMDVLDLIPGYVVLIETADFSINYANNFFRERFGKVTGKACYELIFGRSKVCENCGILNIFSLNYPYYGEMTDSKGRVYEVVRFPFNNVDGKSLVFEMGTDVTEKRNLEKIIQTRINKAEEKERKRIASDLHDDLGPTLCSVKLQLSSLHDKIDNNLLKGCVELLTESIERMRVLANNISPNLVENHGLETAIKSFISQIEQSHQVRFNFKSNLKESRIYAEAELNLYRIITELVKNTISHSKGNEANIELHLNRDTIRLIYFDNGIGYNVDEAPSPNTGIGLQNIKNRVKILNGTLDFKRIKGHTVVEINVRTPEKGE